MLAPIAEAAYKPGTQKTVPKDRRSDAGTTRGCSGEDIPLTVLASRNYVGRTTSQHPMFAWFVPRDSASKSMEFTIYEWMPSGKPKEIRKMSLQSSLEIMKLSPFTKNEPGLQPGKRYLWQVVIQCDPDNPSGNLVSQTNLEVVAMSTSVQSKLNRAVNHAEKANVDAEQGLWYDALSEALKLTEAGTSIIKIKLYNIISEYEAGRDPP